MSEQCSMIAPHLPHDLCPGIPPEGLPFDKNAPTPRTDALFDKIGEPQPDRSWENNVASFARQLERELVEAALEAARLKTALQSAEGEPILPCDVTVGAGTFRRGVAISTLQGAINRLVSRSNVDVDAIMAAEQMGGDDRWALGYNEAIKKMAYLWKRETVSPSSVEKIEELQRAVPPEEWDKLPRSGVSSKLTNAPRSSEPAAQADAASGERQKINLEVAGANPAEGTQHTSSSHERSNEVGWLIENGKQGDELRYRNMEQGVTTWTADPNEALRFARRADAEKFAAEDEDAWLITEHMWSSAIATPVCTGCRGMKGHVGDRWVRNQCTGYGGSYERGWIACEHCNGTGVEP
jgi:hypothetical protein